MAFIVAIAVLSTVALEVLAHKKMKVALFVYGVAYVFLIAWAAMVLGMCAATETDFRGWSAVPNFQDWEDVSVFHAISTLNIYEQSALAIMVAVSIIFTLSCLATVYTVKRVVKKIWKGKFEEKVDCKKSNLYCILRRKFAFEQKIYLRLCRFLN